MNILFIRNFPSVDGSFTLLLRLGERFKQDGHNVFYVDFGIVTKLDSEIKKIFNLVTTKQLVANHQLPHIDVLFPFADGDLLYWSLNELKNKLFKNAKFILGVYHPRTYFIATHLGPSPDTRIYKKLLSKIPSENIVFMNEIVKKNHETYLKLQFIKSPIIPLPVKLEGHAREYHLVNRKKIVSIGRLENFKKYVLAMIDVVEQLNEGGDYYEFYIYGHGQLKEYIVDYIKLKNIQHFIFFMGEMEYKNLHSTLQDTFLFIGMGTLIIEASSMGVPSLLAIDSERLQLSYGYFCNLKGLSVGEINENFQKFDIKKSIKELAQKDQQEYIAFAKAHIKKASIFNINNVIDQYYSFIDNARVEFNFKLPTHKLVTNKIVRQIFKIKAIVKKEHRGR